MGVERQYELAQPEAVVLALERLALGDRVVPPVLEAIEEGRRRIERAEHENERHDRAAGRENVDLACDREANERRRSEQDHREGRVVERARASVITRQMPTVASVRREAKRSTPVCLPGRDATRGSPVSTARTR